MKRVFFLLATLLILGSAQSQDYAGIGNETSNNNLSDEVNRLREIIKNMQESDLQSEKVKYLRNYQMVLYGIEIIKEIRQGSMEISAARSQNILYKKIIDINNPTSETLGFQLLDVIDKSIGDNVISLPLAESEKKRMRGQVSGFVEGMKRTFPPLQIITGALATLSSFTSYTTRVEKVGKKADSIIIDAHNPITTEIMSRINNQLGPYVDFYSQLNKINSKYENALYGHVIEYKDFLEEVESIKAMLDKYVNINESIGEQVNQMFNLSNSSRQDFEYKKINENENNRNLAGICVNVYSLVERYKKFTNDFINIQDDFYRDNIAMLNERAKKLPIKDDGKIDGLIADLTNIKKGNPNEGIPGFDESYKSKIKSIVSKLYVLNRTRF